MTLHLNQFKRLKPSPRGALGEVLSSDEASREVELAFIKRYTHFAVKSSRSAIKTAYASSSKQDELEVSTMASLELMRNSKFAEIARELERQVPEDLDFGRFGGKK